MTAPRTTAADERAGTAMTPMYERAGISLFQGDCREVLAEMEDESADLLITDPPYGFRKAEWDGAFTDDWLQQAARVTRRAMAIMPGVNNILRMPRSIPPFEYRWMLSIHLSNGMTRGLLGFGNWIPVLVYGREGKSLYRPQQDATAVPVGGDMPDHPSPKPLRAMTWLLSRFEAGSVIDPFAGSGTTLLAAKALGWPAVGIERDADYCELIVDRLRQDVLPLALAPDRTTGKDE